MDTAYPTLRIAEFVSIEFHCVPQVVVAPVLPVLDPAVNGHSQLTVFCQNLKQFGTWLVALTALHETVTPERKHGNGAGKLAYASYHTVCVSAVNEIVVTLSSVVRYK